MPRGGPRKPPARTGPAGPGKFSRRTDGQQIATPGIGRAGEPTELQSGQVGQLEAAQKIAPLPIGTPPPRVGGGGGAPQRVSGMPVGGGRIPQHLLTMEPEVSEPTTSGLDVGEGPGHEVLSSPRPADDVREVVLERLAFVHGNADARMILNRLRSERAEAARPVTAQELPPSPAEPGVPPQPPGTP